MCNLNRLPWAASLLPSVRCVTAEAWSGLQGWWPRVVPVASCIREVPSSWRCSRPKDQTRERVGNKQGDPWLGPPPGKVCLLNSLYFPRPVHFAQEGEGRGAEFCQQTEQSQCLHPDGSSGRTECIRDTFSTNCPRYCSQQPERQVSKRLGTLSSHLGVHVRIRVLGGFIKSLVDHHFLCLLLLDSHVWLIRTCLPKSFQKK